jgi:hypothetical protein
MKKSNRNQKLRKYTSKRKINTRKDQYQMFGSSTLSSSCKKKITNMFKTYISKIHHVALKSIIYELLQKHPIALIKFIETYFIEKVILKEYNNDNCFKIFLNVIQNDFNNYKDKVMEVYAYDVIPMLTMKELVSILQKGIFAKKKLLGGQGSSDDEEEPEICAICREAMQNSSDILSLGPCGHTFHSFCIRMWLLSIPPNIYKQQHMHTCPSCRQIANPLPQLSEQQEQNFLRYLSKNTLPERVLDGQVLQMNVTNIRAQIDALQESMRATQQDFIAAQQRLIAAQQDYNAAQQDFNALHQELFDIEPVDPTTFFNRLRTFLNQNLIPGLLGEAMIFLLYFRNMANEVVLDMVQVVNPDEMLSSQSLLILVIMFLLSIYNISVNYFNS